MRTIGRIKSFATVAVSAATVLFAGIAANAKQRLVTDYIERENANGAVERIFTSRPNEGIAFEQDHWTTWKSGSRTLTGNFYNFRKVIAVGGTNFVYYAFRDAINPTMYPNVAPRFSRTCASAGSPSVRWLYGPFSENAPTNTLLSFGSSAEVEAAAIRMGLDATASGTLAWQTSSNDWAFVATYDADGGTPAQLVQTFTNDLTLAACPFRREGYTFDGWVCGGRGCRPGERIHLGESDDDPTILAAWKGVPYSIRFNKNDSTATGAMKDLDCVYGITQRLSVCEFQLTGHDFVGWALKADGPIVYGNQDKVCNLTSEADGIVELFAVWGPAEVIVDFNPAGGIVSPTEKKVMWGEAYGELPTPTHAPDVADGMTTTYVFDGWLYNGNRFTAESQVTLTTRHTLMAKWLFATTGNVYRVTFRTDYGETPEPMSFRHGETYAGLPVLETKGRDFAGWFLGEEAIRAVDRVRLTADAEFVAKWTPKSYELELAFQGGSNGTETVTVRYDEPLPNVERLPEREGYEFLGYFDSTLQSRARVYGADGVAAIPAWTNAAGATLYAQWKRIPAPLTVVFDFGEGFGIVTNTVLEGETIQAFPEPPAREGHRLLWWYDETEGPMGRITEKTVVTRNLNVKAQWTLARLNEALGIDTIAFETDSERGWLAETETEYLWDGQTNAVRSGVLDGSGESILKAYVPSRGRLSFNWACDMEEIDPENPYIYLNAFYWGVRSPNETCQTGIRRDWSSQRVTVEPQNASGWSVIWQYAKVMAKTPADRCWIANVTWVPYGDLLPFAAWDVAVDAPSLAFATDGAKPWGVTEKAGWFADGTNGLVTAETLADGETCEVSLTVTGPKVLRYKWKTSCESGACARDHLEFLDNGVRQGAIDGVMENFEEAEYLVPSGEHRLVWRYAKDASGFAGADRAFLDSVTLEDFVPEAVTVTIAGTCETNVYDGTEQTAEGYRVVAIGDARYTENDFRFSGEAKARGTEAGTYPMGLAPGDFVNRNGLFAPTFVVTDGELVIGKAALKPRSTDAFAVTASYDGRTHGVAAAAIAAAFPDRTAGDVAFAALAEGPWQAAPISLVDAGTTSYWCRVTGGANYTDYIGGVQVTVKPVVGVTVRIVGNAATNRYDGGAHTVSGFAWTADCAAYREADFAFGGTSNAVRTAVGVTRFGLSPNDFCNVNGNFESVRFAIARDGELVVLPREMAAEEPGSGTVPEGGVSKFDVATDYDGGWHAPDAAGIAAAFETAYGACEVAYAQAPEGPWSAEPPRFRSPGVRSVWYRVTADNYETYVHELRVTIRGAGVTAEVGRYFGVTLEELGVGLASDPGVTWSVKAEGLPKGLSLKQLKAKTEGGWYVEGVPTEELSLASGQVVYLRLVRTVNRVKTESVVRLALDVVAPEPRALRDGTLAADYGTVSIEELWPESVGASYSGWPGGLRCRDGELSGKPTKAGVFTVTATRKNVPSRFTTAKYSEKLTATLTVNPSAEERGVRYENRAYVAVSMPDFDLNWAGFKSVSGLPTGLKYNSSAKPVTSRVRENGVYVTVTNALPHELYGKPTKAGVFTVTLTLTDPENPKKTLKSYILWRITPGANEGSELVGAPVDADGIARVGVGLPLNWSVASDADAKVTVSGLPTGLKFKNGVLAGVPTKGGVYVIAFKTVLNGRTVVQRVAVETKSLSSRLVGTYRGAAASSLGGVPSPGLFTATVSSAGKISGSFCRLGKKVSFKADSFDRYDAARDVYVAKVAYTLDRVKYADEELEFAVVSETDVSELWQVTCGEGGAGLLTEVRAYRDCLKEDLGKLPKELATTHAIDDASLAEGEYLNARVSTSGAVTVAGKLLDASGKLQSVSCSTQLLPIRTDRLVAPISVYKAVSRTEPIVFDAWWELGL